MRTAWKMFAEAGDVPSQTTVTRPRVARTGFGRSAQTDSKYWRCVASTAYRPKRDLFQVSKIEVGSAGLCGAGGWIGWMASGGGDP